MDKLTEITLLDDDLLVLKLMHDSLISRYSTATDEARDKRREAEVLAKILKAVKHAHPV